MEEQNKSLDYTEFWDEGKKKEYNENSIFSRLQGLIDPFLARFEDNDIIL